MNVEDAKPSELPDAYREFLRAAYNGDVEAAAACLHRDPECIKAQDPNSGVTALHIAILRQAAALVHLIATQPHCNAWLRDRFNRTAPDMLVYTTNKMIFDEVMALAYPEQEAMWPDRDASPAP